ncbi:hypothetical protein WDU94_011141 [Cyamophila willieti]
MFPYFCYSGLLMRNQPDHLHIKEDTEDDIIDSTTNINNNRIGRGSPHFPPHLLSPTLYHQGGLNIPVMSSLFIPTPQQYIQGINTWTPPLSASKYPSSQISVDTQPSKKRRKSDSQESTSPDLQAIPLSPPTSGSSPQSNASAGSIPEEKQDNKEKVFTCNICNRSFGYKHVLQNHERTHTGEKPFECLECGKRFTRDHHLKTHMRLHTGEKPYHCSHCDRHFVQVANLRRHLRVHTGERPYNCELCASKFSDSNQLKAHMLIHRGEKPFNCTKCNSQFRRKHHLNHHKCNNNVPSTPNNEVYDYKADFLEMDNESDYRTQLNLLLANYNNGTLPLINKRERKSRDIRRVIRFPPVPAQMLLPSSVQVPEQTEPEDLSMPSRRLTTSCSPSPTRVLSNNNESPSHVSFNNNNSTCSSPRHCSEEEEHSHPPTSKLVLDVDFIHRHPKFRTKNNYQHHLTASP